MKMSTYSLKKIALQARKSKELDIVDTMISIISTKDEPAPKHNTKKKQNSANRFYNENQAEYEARGKQSGDRVAAVQRHNRACPKMYHELQKRSSIVKVTTISSQRITDDVDLNCAACAKLLTFRKLKREQVKPKCARVCKRSYAMRRRRRTIQKRKQKKGARSKKPRSAKADIGNNSCVVLMERDSEELSQGSHRYPKEEKRALSMTSYNSFLSMEQEPMVTN